MNNIRTEQRTVYVTATGAEFTTLEQAEAAQVVVDMTIVLENLDVYWREACPAEVAWNLYKAGYVIVHNDKEPT